MSGRVIGAMVVALVTGFAGCNGGKHAEEGPICSEIAEACHHAAEMGTSTEAEDCHDLAHDADEDACDAQRDDCVALCDQIMETMEM
jgi:hypothetical protein